MAATGNPIPENAPPDNASKIEFYKLRAEEFRERYESMRSLEWNVLVQTYTGYTAIAIAFGYLKQWHILWVVCDLAMLVTLLFFMATQYLSFRIQERLITFGVTYENWGENLNQLFNVHDTPRPGTGKLGHPYFWTYDIQLRLALFTCLGLLGYETMLAWNTPQPWSVLLPILWAVLSGAAAIYAFASRYIVRAIYQEILDLYRPGDAESTIWIDYRRKQKKSGTPATDRT